MASAAPAWQTRSLEVPLQDEYLLAQRWGLSTLGTYNPKSRLPGGGLSDHARYPARAFDVGGNAATLDRFFKAMVNRPGIEYVIYRDKIWSRTRGLHEYKEGGHETHVHVSGTAGARPGTPPLTAEQKKNIAQGIIRGTVKPSDLPPGSTIRTGGPFADEARAVAGAIKSPLEAFKWISNNWDRVLEVGAGFILLLVGLVLLGRSMGVGGKRLGGDLANRLQYGPTVVKATRDPGLSRPQKIYVDEAAPRASSGYDPSTAEIPF